MARLKLTPPIEATGENPYLLLARLMKLAARFGIPLEHDASLARLVVQSLNRLREWQAPDSFHGEYARRHGYRALFDSILRAPDRMIFLRRLHDSSIASTFLPEIDIPSLLASLAPGRLIEVTTVGGLVDLLYDSLGHDSSGCLALRQRLSVLN